LTIFVGIQVFDKFLESTLLPYSHDLRLNQWLLGKLMGGLPAIGRITRYWEDYPLWEDYAIWEDYYLWEDYPLWEDYYLWEDYPLIRNLPSQFSPHLEGWFVRDLVVRPPAPLSLHYPNVLGLVLYGHGA
jgi:hypothetical protein